MSSSTAQPPQKKSKFHQNKTKSFFRSHKKQYFEVGQRGFLATCNFREKDCVRECYNILNQYANELYGPQEPISNTTETTDEAAADTGDIADDLQKEIAAAKQKGKDAPKQRFQNVDTGATNCVFIRTTLPNPVELGQRIVNDIASSREQKSRYLLRLIPVEVVCRANMTDITAAGGKLFDKHFLKQGSTFSIVYNKRFNNDVKRDDVIRELAALVQSKNIGNRVDLKQAAKTVIVEVIKGLCCLSVVEGYLQHKKYNLVELANVKEEKEPESASAGTDEMPKSEEKPEIAEIQTTDKDTEVVVFEAIEDNNNENE